MYNFIFTYKNHNNFYYIWSNCDVKGSSFWKYVAILYYMKISGRRKCDEYFGFDLFKWGRFSTYTIEETLKIVENSFQ